MKETSGLRAVLGILAAAAAVSLSTCGDLGGPMEWASYSVVYHSGDGSGRTAVSVEMAGRAHVVRDSMFDNPGHGFVGWRTREGRDVPPGLPLEGSASGASSLMELFAQWKAHAYTVVYDPNGGTGTMPSSGFVYGIPGELRKNSFLPPAGETFAGWAAEPAGYVRFLDGEAAGNLTDEDGGTVTLYARWGSGDFEVEFMANGGVGHPPPTMYGNLGQVSAVILPNADGLTKPDHAFDGWNSSPDGSGDLFRAGERFVPVGSVTLYATWRRTGGTPIPERFIGKWYDDDGLAFEFARDETAGVDKFFFPGDVRGFTVVMNGDVTVVFSFASNRVGSVNARYGYRGELEISGSSGNVSLDGTYRKNAPGAPPLVGTVRILGRAEVGEELFADIGGLSGDGDVRFAWLSGDAVRDETGQTYAVTPDDAGGVIKVRVSRDGFSGQVESEGVTVDLPGLPPLAGTVAIIGEAKIGETLLADTSGLFGDGPVKHEWFRDGDTIPGATAPSRTLTADDLDRMIKVRVRRDGFSGYKDSEAVGPVADSFGGIRVPGENLGAMLSWLRENAEDGESYLAEPAAQGFVKINTSEFAMPAGMADITVTVDGKGGKDARYDFNYDPNAGGDGDSMVVVVSGVTLILENITLYGGFRSVTDDSFAVVRNGGRLVIGDGVKLDSHTSRAPNRGGGITVESGGELEMTGGEITSFRLEYDGSGAANGGGVLVKSGGKFAMSGGKINQNILNENPGGNPEARGGGAGVAIESGGEFTMTGGEITRNRSSGMGGGGGVLVMSGGKFTMEDGTIGTLNTAEGGGGGVMIDGLDGEFTINGGIIRNNGSDGGAVMVASGGKFTMNGGEISSNTFNGNSTNKEGGGGVVVASGGTFTMNGGKVTLNDSKSNGIGVLVKTGGKFGMNSGEISGNKPYSGSIVDGGGVFVESDGEFTMAGGTIKANIAGGHGGGVYSEGVFRIGGGIVYGNTGTANQNKVGNGKQGAALYLSEGGSADYGRLDGDGFTASEKLGTDERTIEVVNGVKK